jgi:hypothetical protein
MGNFFDELQNVFICDGCDTLATVSMSSDTITVQQCECVTLDWENDNV